MDPSETFTPPTTRKTFQTVKDFSPNAPLQRRQAFARAQSSANLECTTHIYIYILVGFNPNNKIEEDESNIGGALLLEAAKLKSAPSASNIKVGSRFRPLNEVEQVIYIYIYIY